VLYLRRPRLYRPGPARWMLIDEFPGRVMAGRRLVGRLHQGDEGQGGPGRRQPGKKDAGLGDGAQNYFRPLTAKALGPLDGGPRHRGPGEFLDYYKMDVAEIPTNRAGHSDRRRRDEGSYGPPRGKKPRRYCSRFEDC